MRSDEAHALLQDALGEVFGLDHVLYVAADWAFTRYVEGDLEAVRGLFAYVEVLQDTPQADVARAEVFSGLNWPAESLAFLGPRTRAALDPDDPFNVRV